MAAALVGVDELELPKWTEVDQQVVKAGLWRTLRALPAGIRIVVGLAWQTSKKLTLLTGLLSVAAGCVTAFGLLATADVLTTLLAQGPTADRVVASLPAVGLVVLSYSLRALLETASGSAQAMLQPRVEHAAQQKVHEAVARVELIAFEDSDYADLLRQCLSYGMRAVEVSIIAIASISGSVFNLAAAVFSAGVLHPMLAPVVLLAVGPNVWASARAAKLVYGSYLRMVSRFRRQHVASELLTERETAAEMRASTAGNALLDEYRRVSEALTAEAAEVELGKTRVRLVGRAIAGIGTGAGYTVLGLLLHAGWLALPLAGTAAVAMRLATTALGGTMMNVNMLYEQTLYLELYTRLINLTVDRTRPDVPLRAPDPDRIDIESVTFSYPDQDSPALDDVSLTIHKGQVVALVGENGSGKSTLAKLITGLYLPTAGKVRWDGVDLASVAEESIYQQISLVLQDPARWPMTAYDNIRMGRIDRAGGLSVEAAAMESGADKVIEELPKGYDTLLSKLFKEGRDLSGGQWQRISVARGIYRDSPILVVDEPTAAMDARAEHAVFESLRRLSEQNGRTTILITHRLANVQHADVIIVLDHGKVVEQGTHGELMALDGTYASLFSLQASMFLVD
ncbi:ABC transporter ATP-binding protein [Actinocrispum sp. NPDC049592]|uniref:ABC transporter ATP-binding protein n=1 Tax=Actinocrispum sp. NPDC049592 TaxID=3154835 RepID=UPI00341EBD2E